MHSYGSDPELLHVSVPVDSTIITARAAVAVAATAKASSSQLPATNLVMRFLTLKDIGHFLIEIGKDQKGLQKRGIHDQGDLWKFPLETTV